MNHDKKRDFPCPFVTPRDSCLDVMGLYAGSSAFLIAGGPSFALVDRGKLHDVWSMTLNNAVTSYRGNASCIVDEPSRFNYSLWLDPKIQKFVPASCFNKPLWDNRLLVRDGVEEQRWQESHLTVNDCPNVIGYRQNEKFDAARFLYEDTINWGCNARFGGGRSVMLAALRILFLLGFRNVYLLGVDFEMSESKKYHFSELRAPAAIRGNMQSYARLQRWFSELQPYFLQEGFHVKNCNAQSRLKAFPFIPFEQAVVEASSILGDYKRERTVGMYKPIKSKASLGIGRQVNVEYLSGLETAPCDPESHKHSNTGTRIITSSRVGVKGPKRNHLAKRRIILRNFQAPGDIVMLTGAVRDLHKCYPGEFITDVRTPCPQLWENNPYLRSLSEEDPSVQSFVCDYPLIHRSNTEPWHFIHGFSQYLNETLGLSIRPTAFKGDIHLTNEEKGWISQVQEITKEPVPFWIIGAGGKRDYTIKWWAGDRFQTVVNHFKNRILFVQVGEAGHEHPPLQGVLDLRGKTDLRQLVRLVHHAQGVLCPVTLLMHLAAAVETRQGMPKNRACVVVAGGREPAQWEAYPHHQFIHTNGALQCCDNGGCWKSRVIPLGDGDEKDMEENLCSNVVFGAAARSLAIGPLRERIAPVSEIGDSSKNAHRYPRALWKQLLPRCMDIITPSDVVQCIEMYFLGGSLHYLNMQEAEVCSRRIPSLGWE